jgi:hypothetical protein
MGVLRNKVQGTRYKEKEISNEKEKANNYQTIKQYNN